uniref:Uncharacterized protein n=1 Tax=Cacopsylla melanoneura TaxID=428564 RepID=A0A8D8SEX4_9HEMI
MLINSLRSQQSCVLIELITHILVVLTVQQENSHQLRQVFLETRVVSNLLLAIKNISKDPTQLKLETDESGKQMLTRIFMFLNYMMYTDTGPTSDSSSLRFLHQLCDTIVVFKMEAHFSHLLLLSDTLCRHILAIFILIATQIPDNTPVVSSVLQYDDTLSNIRNSPGGDIQDKVRALIHLIPVLSES